MKAFLLWTALLFLPFCVHSQLKTEIKLDVFNLIYADPHVSLELMPSKKLGIEIGAKYNFDELSLDTTGVISTSNEGTITFKQQSLTTFLSAKFYPIPNRFSNRLFTGIYFHQEIETKSATGYEELYENYYDQPAPNESNRSAVGVLFGYKWFPKVKQKFFVEFALNYDWNIKSLSGENNISSKSLALFFFKVGKRI